MKDPYNNIEQMLGKGNVKKNVDLFSSTTLHTKTLAEYYYVAKSREDLQKGVMTAIKYKIPFFIIAGGSNIAITKRFLQGLVIKNNYEKKEQIGETEQTADLLVSSGYQVAKLVQETIKNGLGGFEYHKGLPGTVGGALYMNSKWTKPPIYFSDPLLYAFIFDAKGIVKRVEKSYFKFAYDYSVLHDTHEIILEAVFRLRKEPPEVLRRKSEEALLYRLKTQPTGVSTLGCFFKNVSEQLREQKGLPTRSAGYLIDKAGLKGWGVGSFQISEKHANFIVNKGKGNPEDLLKLLNVIKKKVKEKFGIGLEEEVIII